jgi:hypothetical protein
MGVGRLDGHDGMVVVPVDSDDAEDGKETYPPGRRPRSF